MRQPTLTIIKKQFNKVAPSYGIKKAALFGSWARGANKKGSDIDILIDLPKGKTLLDLVSIQQDLERALKSQVDIVTYNSLHPLLKENILQEQKVIYERD